MNIASWFELGPTDHALTVMPLFHIHGLVAGVLAPIAGGGSVTPVPFDAFAFGSQIAELQPTWCSAVPSMWELVLARWRNRADELRAAPWRFLRTSSSALSATLMAELEAVFEVPVLEAYGMTEAAHQIAANPLPPGQRTADSVGLATGDVRIRIAKPDENGEGHIQITGSTIIDGYLSGEAPESFEDGWFATGDQGRLDDDGRLFITGRISEFINRGGDKLSPREIEGALNSVPGVERAVAFPLPHPVLGQVPAAAVVACPDAELDVAAINEHVATLLSRPKRPTKLEIVDDWPLGPTGKLQRKFLAEQLGWA
jgi:acyl-CoA synthetase (AMP-forming)/AMP-acid ligase II